MDPRIKEDILKVLHKTVNSLKQQDFVGINELSNHTLHNASIFQDADSISTATLVYAIAKIVQRCTETQCPVPPIQTPLEKAIKALESDKFPQFRNAYKEAFDAIGEHDKKLKLYVQHVLENAKIRKGGKLARHGISLGRIADMMGISQWDLYNYIGKTTVTDEMKGPMSVQKRLAFARGLFK